MTIINKSFDCYEKLLILVLDEETEIVDVIVIILYNVKRRGGKEVKGIGIKGWGSCYQARDQSGSGLATMSKTHAFQVNMGFLSFFHKGFG
jgi:hypothetical protein